MTYYSLNVGATKERVGKFSLLLVAITLAVAAALTIFSTVKAEEPEVEVVTGNTAAGFNEPGWLFNRDATAQYEFTKDEASRGVGSLYVGPISAEPSDKFIAEYFYLGSVDEFEGLSYDFTLGEGSDPSDAKHFYLNVYANLPESDVTAFYDCRFDYVPQSGSLAGFEEFSVTKTTTATTVQPRNDVLCPATLDELPDGSTIRAFSINVGDGAAHDEGVHGYIDNVVLSETTSVTVFDFEPFPASKQECMRGGWTDYGFSNQGLCIQYVNTGRDSR